MGELMDYIKANYLNTKDKTGTASQMEKSKVKNTIINLCDEHLKEAGQVFTFEASAKDLPYVIAVIEEEPLRSKYTIYQVSETLFEASLKEIEL